jgi:hypothetical protein
MSASISQDGAITFSRAGRLVVYSPGASLEGAPPAVKALAEKHWTDEFVEAYKRAIAGDEDGDS